MKIKNYIEEKELLEVLHVEPDTREKRIKGYEDRIAGLWKTKNDNQSIQFDDNLLTKGYIHTERLSSIDDASKDYQNIQF